MSTDEILILPFESLKDVGNFEKESIIHSIQRLEKKIFPKNEQMEILTEVKKRTNTLVVAMTKNNNNNIENININNNNLYKKENNIIKNKLKNKKKSKANLKNKSNNKIETTTNPIKNNTDNYIVSGYLIYSKKDSIIKFAVDPTKRNNGLGWKLLSYSMERMTNQTPKNHKINLAVDISRLPAQHLYTKAGFKIKEQINDYYEPGRHAYIMEYIVV